MKACLIIPLVMAQLSGIQAMAQWEQMPRDTNLFGDYYSSIAFVSDSVGFLVGCDGTSAWNTVGLFQTKNAGTAWRQIQGTTGGGCRIPTSFVNDQTGYCVLTHGTQQPNDLLRTSDGGASWNNPNPTAGFDIGNQYFNGELYFVNDTLGMLAKDDTLYRTTNGGVNWQRVNTGSFIKAFAFTSPQTGFAAGNNSILKTVDGGITWSVATTNYSIESISFPSPAIGYAVGANGTIIKTINAGQTWTVQGAGNSGPVSLNSAYAVDNNTCYAVGDGGVILHTQDGGNNWIRQHSGITARLNSISCTRTHCYVVGDTGVILRTRDGALGLEHFEPYDNVIQIFPNPMSKTGKIRINNPTITRVAIYSLEGKSLPANYTIAGQEINIMRGDLPSGIYFIQLVQANGMTHSSKMIITD